MGKANPNINPMQDGKTHINMYYKSRTNFGKMLSNFYPYRFTTPYDGDFASVEAYWYYLSLPATVDRNAIRDKAGYPAKACGRSLRKQAGEANLIFRNDFEDCILGAIRMKVHDNRHLFKDSYRGLPIMHYYSFNGRIIDVTSDFPWLIDGITQIIKNEFP